MWHGALGNYRCCWHLLEPSMLATAESNGPIASQCFLACHHPHIYWTHVTALTCEANVQSINSSLTWTDFVYTNHKSKCRILTVASLEPVIQIFFALQPLITSLTIFVGAKTKQSFGPEPPTFQDNKGLQNRCKQWHSEPAWLRSWKAFN